MTKSIKEQMLLTDEEINKAYKAAFMEMDDRFRGIAKAQVSKCLSKFKEIVEEAIWKSHYIIPTNKPKVLNGILQKVPLPTGDIKEIR